MATKDALLKTRFLLSMGRIHGLVQLLYSNEALKSARLLQSEGTKADILRSIVVLLHAIFEVVLRSHLPKPNKNLSFYSHTDLDKALRLSGIDATPFRPLYPSLTQMAKRRKRIVHNADLVNRTDTVPETWGIADDWQLIMWLLAVPAFYYQLRMAVNDATMVERTAYERFKKGMARHVDFGKQLVAFPQVPPELQREEVGRMAGTLQDIAGTLKLDV